MAEITKDFIKFVAEVVALLLIFSVVFGTGMASDIFNYLNFAEPILLQNYVSSAMTAGSQADGNFSSGIKLTSGMPNTIKIFLKNGIPYVNVIPSQTDLSGTTFSSIEPTPIITDCNLQEQEMTLPAKTAQELIVEKIVENGKCSLALTMAAGLQPATSSVCSCPDGYECQSDGTCKVTTTSTCSATCQAQNYATGTCEAGTTTTTSSTNLVAIPNAWTQSITGQRGIGGQPGVSLDTSVTYNGQPTLKIDCGQSPVVQFSYGNQLDPEADSYYFPHTGVSFKPGDHVVFHAYVKTQASTLGDTSSIHGAQLDIDLYGANGRIQGINAPDGSEWTPQNGWPANEAANTVPFGTSGWKYVSIDFIIPQQAYADGWGGPYVQGTLVPVTGMIPCLFIQTGMWTNGQAKEGGSAWWGDIELYVCHTGDPDFATCGQTQPTTTGSCQSGETAVADSCSSGTCCCSGS